METKTTFWFVKHTSGYYSFYPDPMPTRDARGGWPKDRPRTLMGPHCAARLVLGLFR